MNKKIKDKLKELHQALFSEGLSDITALVENESVYDRYVLVTIPKQKNILSNRLEYLRKVFAVMKKYLREDELILISNIQPVENTSSVAKTFARMHDEATNKKGENAIIDFPFKLDDSFLQVALAKGNYTALEKPKRKSKGLAL